MTHLYTVLTAYSTQCWRWQIRPNGETCCIQCWHYTQPNGDTSWLSGTSYEQQKILSAASSTLKRQRKKREQGSGWSSSHTNHWILICVSDRPKDRKVKTTKTDDDRGIGNKFLVKKNVDVLDYGDFLWLCIEENRADTQAKALAILFTLKKRHQKMLQNPAKAARIRASHLTGSTDKPRRTENTKKKVKKYIQQKKKKDEISCNGSSVHCGSVSDV